MFADGDLEFFFLEIKRIRLYMYYYSVLLYKDLISLFKMYSRVSFPRYVLYFFIILKIN